MSDQTLDVTLRVQAKHADLWEAAKKLGGQSALADHLGVSPQEIGRWINLKKPPPIGTTTCNSKWSDQNFVADMERKLFALTGKLLSELWPEQLRHNRAFWEAEKSCELSRELDVEHLLSDRTVARLTLPSPEDAAIANERQERLTEVLETLPSRDHEILKRRFGLNGERSQTLAEVAKALGLTVERIRQIEIRAIRVLGNPGQSRRLAGVSGITDMEETEDALRFLELRAKKEGDRY